MKFRFPRIRNLDRFRVYSGLIILSTLLLWYRSGRHWDSLALAGPNRIYAIQSGFGELSFEISGQIGNGWRFKFESVQTDNAKWPKKPIKYERRLLSLTLGISYWAIVLIEVASLILLVFCRKKRRRRKSRPRKSRKKAS